MIRVAYICADPGVPVFGTKGASVHVQEVVRALRRRGAHVEIFTARPGDAAAAPPDLAGVPLQALPRAAGVDGAARERAGRAANRALAAALARRGAGAFDLVYERYSLWSHAGMTHARAHRIPGVVEVNAPLIDEQARHRALADRAAAERLARHVFDTAGAVVAVSEPVAAWARQRTTRPERVHVVPNGVDPRRFRPRPAGPRRDGGFTVGFVGTLKPWHDLDGVVAAVGDLAAREPGWRLLVVGDGPQRARLEALATRRGVPAEFTGAVVAASVPAQLRRMDAAVATYTAGEAYFSPLKVYEYLAAGLPTVASRTGQVAEVVVDGVTGFLVEPGQPQALAAALRTLRADPARRRALGAAGRRAVARAHTWDAVVGRILAVAGPPGGAPVSRAGAAAPATVVVPAATGRRPA